MTTKRYFILRVSYFCERYRIAPTLIYKHFSPQEGGQCEVYLCGDGRHGQMGENNRFSLSPFHQADFSEAQLVVLGRSVIYNLNS